MNLKQLNPAIYVIAFWDNRLKQIVWRMFVNPIRAINFLNGREKKNEEVKVMKLEYD